MSVFLRKQCLCLGFLLLHLLNQVSATLRCPSRCPSQCPSISPTCAPGVRSVLDGCSCCPVCARQRGESCSEMRPCDQSSGLYCDRSADPNNETGICMVPEGDNCVFDGVIYRNGEKFEPNCQYHCTCRDGQIGCVPRCQLDVLLPGPDCPAPKKVAVPGECCEKWTCGSEEKGTLGGLALPAYRPEATVGVELSDSSINCIEQTTEWSACSKSCGMGLSTLTQWQRRYFYLFPNRLEWRGEGEAPQSLLTMEEIQSVEETQIKERKCLLLKIRGGKQFVLQCDSDPELVQWKKSCAMLTVRPSSWCSECPR